jgi:segregation and condensation protein B
MTQDQTPSPLVEGWAAERIDGGGGAPPKELPPQPDPTCSAASSADVTPSAIPDTGTASADAASVDVPSVDTPPIDASPVDASAVDAPTVDTASVGAASVDSASLDAALVDAASGDAASETAAPAPTPAEPDEESLRLAEALVFASAGPVSARALTQLLPDTADADAVIAALRARYAGRGVELVETAGGVQFRTAPELAPRLRKVIEVPRKLPRVAMETLAIIAYHQPCTRAEIEEIRGTSLSQQTLDALLEANLVAPKGRREVPGRPTLWGTTPQFLAQFGLRDIRDLPHRTDLLLEPPQPSGVSNAAPLTPELSAPQPDAAPRPSHDRQPGESAQPAPEPNRTADRGPKAERNQGTEPNPAAQQTPAAEPNPAADMDPATEQIPTVEPNPAADPDGAPLSRG